MYRMTRPIKNYHRTETLKQPKTVKSGEESNTAQKRAEFQGFTHK